MPLRFKRRLQLFPGMHLNLSKSGAGFSIGRPGASINMGPKGTSMSVGLPGTGLSFKQQSKSGSVKRSKKRVIINGSKKEIEGDLLPEENLATARLVDAEDSVELIAKEIKEVGHRQEYSIINILWSGSLLAATSFLFPKSVSLQLVELALFLGNLLLFTQRVRYLLSIKKQHQNKIERLKTIKQSA